MKTLTWHGCYDLSWKGFITPASFAHPAKMSRGLLERIIAHGFEKGYWLEGGLIGDCFGGVGTTGIIGAYHGLRVVSVELEKKFVSLARRNYALHNSKWKALGSPRPVILQGDSRAFHVLVSKADRVISSPPFNQTPGGAKGINVNGYNGRSDIKPDYLGSRTYQGQGGDRSPGNIETLKEGSVDSVVASPPYAGSVHDGNGIDWDKAAVAGKDGGSHKWGPNSQAGNEGYGQSAGQIGALKSGSVDGVVSSPPYVDGLGHGGKSPACEKLAAEKQHPYHVNGAYGESPGQIERLASGEVSAVVTSPPWENNSEGGVRGSKFKNYLPTQGKGHGSTQEARAAQLQRDEQKIYGDSPGQIGKLKGGSLDGVCTSPPYAANEKSDYLMSDDGKTRERDLKRGFKQGHGSFRGSESYGDSEGQIGRLRDNQSVDSETYWSAMSKVYRACYQAIKPGGVLVLVVKDYVKAGKRVPLCDDTVRLIEHIGFQMVERVHAMLVKETRHADLFGADTKQTTSRKSFFRRLAEKKGSPAIDYEVVLFARKPL